MKNKKTVEMIRELTGLAKAKRFEIQTLGYLDSYPLILCRRQSKYKGAPRKMAAALFHGDEIGGTLGLIEFLKTTCMSELDTVNLSLLPMVNPTGCAAGTRENRWGENPNRGYKAGKEKLSKEGKILLSHNKVLLRLATGGFISLHEDSDIKEGAFVYCYSHKGGVEMAHKMLIAAKKHVGVAKNDILLGLEKSNNGMKSFGNNGIIVDDDDGAYEDWLCKFGIKPVVVTETPAKDTDIYFRIVANTKMMRAFCGFSD
jgi:hypothetical protein